MEFVKKKRGRCLTLRNIDDKLQLHINALRKAGTPVNARIVIAAQRELSRSLITV